MKKTKEAKGTLIYNRKWKIHPDYPDFAFAENGDVCDMTHGPPKILTQYESKDSKSNKSYMRVDIRNRKGTRTSISIANHLVNLYGLRPWEHALYYSFRYKDGDFRNIHISNLEVYKRHPEYKILFESDIKEIEAHIEENKLSQVEIAKKFEVHKDTILRISKKYQRKKNKKKRPRLKNTKDINIKNIKKDASHEVAELLKKFTIKECIGRSQRNKKFEFRLTGCPIIRSEEW